MQDLLLKEILLVEEKDYGGVDKPFIVADGVEQLHALHHPEDKKIIDTDTDTKNILGQFSSVLAWAG